MLNIVENEHLGQWHTTIPYVYALTVIAPQITKIPYGFYFKMTYEAIDRESSIINVLFKKTYIGTKQFSLPDVWKSVHEAKTLCIHLPFHGFGASSFLCLACS